MMGAMNLHRSLSPLHAKCEALIWAMECMKTLQFSDVVFATNCFQLVKMVSTPEEWPAFSTHMEAAVRLSSLTSGSDIFQEYKTPWSSPSAMLYVDYIPPVWLAESVGSA